MATRTWMALYDTIGTKVALFDAPISLEIDHTINTFSTLTAVMKGDDPRTELFGVDYFVEIWRDVDGYTYIEYQGFSRAFEHALDNNGRHTHTSYGRGYLDLVHRRCVLYPDVTPYTLKQGPGETVIKQFVEENAGPSANIAIRDVPGAITGFTVAPTLGLGLTWTDQTHRENLLDLITSISQSTLIDFDVVRNGVTFQFVTFYPQKGIDRRATLTFSPDLDNAIVPKYIQDYRNEANVIVVLGPGSGTSQRIITVQGTDTLASPWNSIETTTSATSHDDYLALVAAGNTALVNNAAIVRLEFDVRQTNNVKYGRDYAVGDIVTGRFEDATQALKITGAKLTIKDGKETIKITVENAPIIP